MNKKIETMQDVESRDDWFILATKKIEEYLTNPPKDIRW